VDSLEAVVNEIYARKAFTELHFFKGQLLLDKLMLNESLSKENRKNIAIEAENEYKKVLNSAEVREKINGYVGLLDLYTEMGEGNKKDFLIVEILNAPTIFSNIFMYYYEYRENPVIAVYLLEKWLEVNPYDNKAKVLFDSLSATL
jgi:hypothetical protein